ncbi:hypothetical protein [Nonomuraea sp. SBT364]|uniref:hypothetical protein n=1 Tax=Nonomuraea sp. SBT364 TaxID=1580530 RepID=UPI00066EB85F|nr:hypothetical protein [Nonomuraea sp. SBT364]
MRELYRRRCAPEAGRGRQDGGGSPLLRLKADAGPAVEVREFPEERAVVGAGDRVAGSATWMRKNIDVYLLRVSLDRPGSGWGVQIVNDGADARTFQFMGLGGTKIRYRDEWPGADLVYCGSFPCACTRHDGDLATACSSCGHRSRPA